MTTERQRCLPARCTTRLILSWSRREHVARDPCQDLNATRESEETRRRVILRGLFAMGGETVWMQPPFYCDYGSNIELGERVFFNFNCVGLDVCRIRIGDFSSSGPPCKPPLRCIRAGNPCRVIRALTE